jgi:hypothetical protein
MHLKILKFRPILVAQTLSVSKNSVIDDNHLYNGFQELF